MKTIDSSDPISEFVACLKIGYSPHHFSLVDRWSSIVVCDSDRRIRTHSRYCNSVNLDLQTTKNSMCTTLISAKYIRIFRSVQHTCNIIFNVLYWANYTVLHFGGDLLCCVPYMYLVVSRSRVVSLLITAKLFDSSFHCREFTMAYHLSTMQRRR